MFRTYQPDRPAQSQDDRYLHSPRMGAYSGEAFGLRSHGLARRRPGLAARLTVAALQGIAVLAFVATVLSALAAWGVQ